jgi:hypothetical protein
MKIGGREVSGVCREVLVLPRLGGDIVFIAEAVVDMSPFDAQVQRPVVPQVITSKGTVDDTDSSSYRVAATMYEQLRFDYITIISLAPSKIEWDTVDMDKPGTWPNWAKDLTKAGLSSVELNRVVNLVMQANCLDEQKLKAARDSFLRGQAATPQS